MDKIDFPHPAWHTVADNGLNLITVFDVDQLPSGIANFLTDDQIPLGRYRRLVMLGNGGARFWDALDQYGWRGDDPIDHFSLHLVDQLMQQLGEEMSEENYYSLYPLTDHLVPLQRLGLLAGWGMPSPIGPSIHPRYGLWFAYRALFLTNLSVFPFTTEKEADFPCDTCLLKPCQTICPAQAVRYGMPLMLTECIDHRLSEGSSCRSTCLSRESCPVGTAHRYPRRVIQHLYEHALDGIQAWRGRTH